MAEILLTDLTNGSLDSNNDWNGDGIFDVLINAVNKNIEGQFKNGRITGNTYANVYLGSMQSAMAESFQFLLNKKMMEAEIDLKVKELDKLNSDIALTDTQKSELEANGAKDRDIKERQMAEEEATGAKNRDILDVEKNTKDYQLNNILPKELDKLNSDIALTDTQKSELENQSTLTLANVGRVKLTTDAEYAKAQKEIDLLESNITKSQQEITLIKQKIIGRAH